jgi:hypothetical protein
MLQDAALLMLDKGMFAAGKRAAEALYVFAGRAAGQHSVRGLIACTIASGWP